MNIIIDPGHGGTEKGAVYGLNGIGVMEKDLNLILASQLYVRLMKHFSRTALIRNNDIRIPMRKRCNTINNKKWDLCISIHCNASEDYSANGFEVLHYPFSTGRILSHYIFTSMTSSVRNIIKPRALVSNDQKAILKTRPTSCIVECGFMSNCDDMANLMQPRTQMIIVHSITKGILNYCGDLVGNKLHEKFNT